MDTEDGTTKIPKVRMKEVIMDDNEELFDPNDRGGRLHFNTERAERAYYMRFYGDLVGVGQDDIQYRLYGARLAAGYVHASTAARLLGLSRSTYKHAEKGLRPVTKKLARLAAELFGISEQFLLEGVVESDREALAERLADIVRQEKNRDYVDWDELNDMAEELFLRLEKMRIAEGHETISAAARAHGWNRSRYWQHEAGTRMISVDRMIAYSLAMGTRPEWAVRGEGQRQEPTVLDWQEQPRDAVPSTGSRLSMR